MYATKEEIERVLGALRGETALAGASGLHIEGVEGMLTLTVEVAPAPSPQALGRTQRALDAAARPGERPATLRCAGPGTSPALVKGAERWTGLSPEALAREIAGEGSGDTAPCPWEGARCYTVRVEPLGGGAALAERTRWANDARGAALGVDVEKISEATARLRHADPAVRGPVRIVAERREAPEQTYAWVYTGTW